ncbi:MAG: exo-beta-N-acetylmuramidase NamZ domain-containing protein [Burkholderiales bacterium]
MNRFVRRCAIAFIAMATAGFATAQPNGFDAIDAVVTREIAAGKAPGAVVLVGNRTSVVYRRAFGQRSLRPVREAMTVDTIFDLASLTKVIATTIAVLHLVDRGMLRLDEPVATYWPEFAANGKSVITVRDVLAHHSGLRAGFPPQNPAADAASARAFISADRLIFPPRQSTLYSDINFIVLGELVRRVSGITLDAYCAQHVFGPLGMRDTTFGVPADRRARVAPTEHRLGHMLRGDVHDQTAARMGGVTGHAGLFSTADDLAILAQMLLNGGERNGVRILDEATVAAMITRQTLRQGQSERGLGWDRVVPFPSDDRAKGTSRSFGHTGFTGTALWIDPASQTFVILLTNRVHPHGRGDVRTLRTSVAERATTALRAQQTPLQSGVALQSGVESGVDVLAASGFAALRGSRIGLITNRSAIDRAARRTLDLLREAPGVTLAALFSPEHGLDADRDETIASGIDGRTKLTVHSLYGSVKRPTPAMLSGIDTLVFDLPDVGVRFYTYATTMAYAMEATAMARIRFVVLDRPNPLGGTVVQGPMLDLDQTSFTGYFPLPVRHGMTIGELAQFFNAEAKLGVELEVIRMRNYTRALWYDQTGLQWIAPSPNLRRLDQAILYPGVAWVEGANVSVGRGTDTPFEVIGAPWIDGRKLTEYLGQRNIAGVSFNPVRFTPTASRHSGQVNSGVSVTLRDRDTLDSSLLGLELVSALAKLFPAHFDLKRTDSIIGSRAVSSAIQAGTDPRIIASDWKEDLERFRARRERHLLYQ